ncbi:MAG: GTP-binding protein, partial [Christensenellaceae bacterium]
YLTYRGKEIRLIDTPGHADFIEEAELALTAVDIAVLVVSAAEGVQAQTEILFDAMLQRELPVVIVVNQCDRPGAKPLAVAKEIGRRTKRAILAYNAPTTEGGAQEDESFEENAVSLLSEQLLERYLEGELSKEEVEREAARCCMGGELIPLVYTSAKSGAGCIKVLDVLSAMESAPIPSENGGFAAFVYQVEHRKPFGKIAHVRVFDGSVSVREEIYNRRSGSVRKAAQIKRIQGERYSDEASLSCGDVGAIVGLDDAKAGDFLGERVPTKHLRITEPYLRVKVSCTEPDKLLSLKAALEMLTDESPSLALEWVPLKRELNVCTSGAIQAEVLKETLFDRFQLAVQISPPSVIYRETPASVGFGFECYTMPKPCWAVVKFLIEPLPQGKGLVYESIVSEKKIAYRYQTHVETEVPRALQQGLKGWQVTDLKVTLVDGEDHVQHTHPMDFFTATPMAIMDGLRNTGTILLEPVLHVKITMPETGLGRVLSALAPRRSTLEPPMPVGDGYLVEADVPASEAADLPEQIASASGGRAVYEARLKGYFPCPEGCGAVRERVGVDPLDRAKWILHARGAL